MTVEQVPHDAFLEEICIDWEPGTATLRFGFESKRITVTVRDLRLLSVPRQQPWGPSIWVNQSSGPVTVGDELAKLSIEMQSGDRLEVVAESIVVDTTAVESA